jgi:hypothetical protein
LALGLAGALIAAGLATGVAAALGVAFGATVFGAEAFLTKVRFFFTGSAATSTAAGVISAFLAAQASGDSLCSPTQNPVELRPQPHFGGSLAGVNGIGVVAAGSGTLYGADTTGSAGAGFRPVKKSIIFFNMLLSPIKYLYSKLFGKINLQNFA